MLIAYHIAIECRPAGLAENTILRKFGSHFVFKDLVNRVLNELFDAPWVTFPGCSGNAA